MLKVTCSTTAVFLFFLCDNLMIYCYAKDVFSVGGVFYEDSNSTELAFRYALKYYNLNSQIIFKTNVHHVPKEDLFTTSKIVCRMLKKDKKLVAIFGPPTHHVAPIVRSTCANLQIPNVQIHWGQFNRKSSSSINLHPDTNLFATGLATVIRNLQWNPYTILYEDDKSLMRLQGVIKDPSQNFFLKQLDSGPNHRHLLKEIKYLRHSPIIIDCNADRIIDILEQAKEIGLLHYLDKYFLTSLDAHTLDYRHLNTMVNITSVRLINPSDLTVNDVVQFWNKQEFKRNPYRQLFVLPNNANKIKVDTALMHDAVTSFASAFEELHSIDPVVPGELKYDGEGTWERGLKIVERMHEHATLYGLTGNIGLQNNIRSTFSLQAVQIHNEERKVLGHWSTGNPTEYIFLRDEKEEQRDMSAQLRNRTLYVSSRLGPPYLMYKINANETIGNDRFEGYSLDLIDSIAKIEGFKYVFQLVEDGKYGNYDPDTKSWNGLIKDLLDRKADLAICDLTITHERRGVVDFTMPFMTLGISIMYSKPSPEERDIFAFMDPIDTVVWMYIVTAYISVTIIIYLVTRMAPGDWESPDPCAEYPEELENIWSFKNCFWITLGSTMSQGCDIVPKGISSRMVTSMWWFFILIINSSYTANLAAFLTMDRMGPSIDSAEALAKQTKIKYGTVEGGATQAFFKNSNFSTYQRMWAQMVQAKPSVFETSNADGVKRVKTTKNQLYAFLMESSSIEYEIERDCDLKQVGGRLDSKGYGIALPLNSPYRSRINNAILNLQEDGKLTALKTKWWKEMHGGGACDEEEKEPVSSLELALANVGGVFVVVGVGLALAFVISFAEFVWNIRTVAFQEHKSFFTVAKIEVIFALSVWITKKHANAIASKTEASSGPNDNSESQNTLTN